MALDLVDKRNLLRTENLSAAEQCAVLAVADGAGSAEFKETALAVMKRARASGLWLRCDCRSENGNRPLAAPCRNHRGTDYWRVLTGRHPEHDAGCVFHRTHARRPLETRWSRPRKAPDGFFAVLRERAEDRRVSRPASGSKEQAEESGPAHRPALSRRLLMLMERARLNRLPEADAIRSYGKWRNAMRDCAMAIEIAPGRPLPDLLFPHVGMWNRRVVHARVRAAAKDWPAGHRAQGFLCWVVWDVDTGGVGTAARQDRVEVVSGVGRPFVVRNPVPPPYLFLGAVGEADARTGYECLEGYAQPIVASDCPTPVDSHHERRAFGTLRATLRILGETFPDAGFTLEKPVFDIETPDGPCLPDFLIRAQRGGDEVTFVVEVMGFERPDYLRGKEVTHPRMANLGTLCTMQAGAFDRGANGLREEGRKVTETIREALRMRWTDRRRNG